MLWLLSLPQDNFLVEIIILQAVLVAVTMLTVERQMQEQAVLVVEVAAVLGKLILLLLLLLQVHPIQAVVVAVLLEINLVVKAVQGLSLFVIQ
jgi:hypothetical protein